MAQSSDLDSYKKNIHSEPRSFALQQADDENDDRHQSNGSSQRRWHASSWLFGADNDDEDESTELPALFAIDRCRFSGLTSAIDSTDATQFALLPAPTSSNRNRLRIGHDEDHDDHGTPSNFGHNNNNNNNNDNDSAHNHRRQQRHRRMKDDNIGRDWFPAGPSVSTTTTTTVASSPSATVPAIVDNNSHGTSDFGLPMAASRDGKVIAVTKFSRDRNSPALVVVVLKLQAGEWRQMGQDLPLLSTLLHNGLTLILSDNGETLAVGERTVVLKDNESKHESGGEIATLAGSVRATRRLRKRVSTRKNGDTVIQVYRFTTADASNDVHSHSQQGAPRWEVLGDAIHQVNDNNHHHQDMDSQLNDETMSLSMSGNGRTVAIGNILSTSTTGGFGTGAVSVYQYDTSKEAWIPFGPVLHGQRAGERFGMSCSLSRDGSVVAVGLSEAVRIHRYDDTKRSWQETGTVPASGSAAMTLSTDGTTVAMTDKHDGTVRVYRQQQQQQQHRRPDSWFVSLKDTVAWQQLGEAVQCGTATRVSAVSLARNGQRLAVGSSIGEACLFEWQASRWAPMGTMALPQDEEPLEGPDDVPVVLSDDGRTVVVGHGVRKGQEVVGHVQAYFVR